MTLKLLDSLSLPGGTPNEDAFAHDDEVALVLDGATPLGDPLMPGPSDAAWIAQFGARRLLAHLKQEEMPLEALRHALADTEKSFTALRRHPVREKWQTPSASLMLAVDLGRRRGNQIDFLWFGDCAALIRRAGQPALLVGAIVDARAKEAARARIALQAGVSPTERGGVLPLLRAGRNHINSGTSWRFSPEPRAADHVARVAHSLAPGTLLLLASDGFLALATDYGAYDMDGLMAAAKEKGLAALGEQTRAIEDADPLAEKFPRFKKSDDATALLIEVT